MDCAISRDRASRGPARPVPCARRRGRRSAGRPRCFPWPASTARWRRGNRRACGCTRHRPRVRMRGAPPRARAARPASMPASRSGGNEPAREQEIARLLAEAMRCRVAGDARRACVAPIAWMRPMKRPSHSSTSRIVQLGRAPAAPRIDREAKVLEVDAACVPRTRAARRRGSPRPRARARTRVPRGSARRSSARADRTSPPTVARPRCPPGRRGSRSCSARAGARRSARPRRFERVEDQVGREPRIGMGISHVAF